MLDQNNFGLLLHLSVLAALGVKCTKQYPKKPLKPWFDLFENRDLVKCYCFPNTNGACQLSLVVYKIVFILQLFLLIVLVGLTLVRQVLKYTLKLIQKLQFTSFSELSKYDVEFRKCRLTCVCCPEFSFGAYLVGANIPCVGHCLDYKCNYIIFFLAYDSVVVLCCTCQINLNGFNTLLKFKVVNHCLFCCYFW